MRWAIITLVLVPAAASALVRTTCILPSVLEICNREWYLTAMNWNEGDSWPYTRPFEVVAWHLDDCGTGYMLERTLSAMQKRTLANSPNLLWQEEDAAAYMPYV